MRLVLTLEETFQATRRAAAEIRVRTGCLSDGTLAFQDIESNLLIGAYVENADRVVEKSSYVAAGHTACHLRGSLREPSSRTRPQVAPCVPGFGTPQVTWAVESNLDECARVLGLDPVAFRLHNLPHYGEAFIPVDTPADGDWEQTLRLAAERIGWGTPLPEGRGRGIALGIKSGPTTGLSYATVRLLGDGSVIVFAGTSDMGQGARTVFAQIAAQELGAPLDWVTVVMGDTAIVPYDQQTSASRSTVLMGNSVLMACRSIQAQLRAMAARLHGVDEAQVSVDQGVVRVGDRELTVLEVLRPGLGPLAGELVGNGEVRKEGNPAHPLGGGPLFFEFNCTAIEADVDEETGDIVIVRLVTVSDVGKALNPLQVRMQDEGAAIMGLGHTLMEHYIYDDAGRIRNLGAIDYRIPTSMDLPLWLHSETVENEDGPGPYGSKGMSEGAVLCVAPAVAAAVRDATACPHPGPAAHARARVAGTAGTVDMMTPEDRVMTSCSRSRPRAGFPRGRLPRRRSFAARLVSRIARCCAARTPCSTRSVNGWTAPSNGRPSRQQVIGAAGDIRLRAPHALHTKPVVCRQEGRA